MAQERVVAAKAQKSADRAGGSEPAVQQRTVATRRRIIDAATSEFIRRGFDGASLRAIAREAGLTDALLHYHFAGKDDLWRCVISELYADLHAHSDAAVAGQRPGSEIEEVRARTRDLMTYTLEKPALTTLISQEFPRKSERVAFLIQAFLGERYDSALVGIQKAQAEGRLPAADPRLIYVVITSLSTILVQRAGEIEMLLDKPITDPDLQDEFWSIIDQLLFSWQPRA